MTALNGDKADDVRKHFAAATRFIDDRHYDHAVDEVLKAEQEQPAYPLIRWRLALLFEAMGNIAKAGRDYRAYDAASGSPEASEEAAVRIAALDKERSNYDAAVQKTFGSGLSVVKYSKDFATLDPSDPSSANDLFHDMIQDSFNYVLKKTLPAISEIAEGPIGWVADITVGSPSSTQTPAQDIDPIFVVCNPNFYTAQHRQAAAIAVRLNIQMHPELWSPSRLQCLYAATGQNFSPPFNSSSFHGVIPSQ